MTSAPVLTLIVPTHEGAAYIVENVRAIVGSLESLGDRFEVLVVCDGDRDGTADAAARIDDPRIRVLRYEHNYGKGYAICGAAACARGRLVGWLDDDLDVSPGAIVHAVERLEQAPIDAVIGSKRHHDSEVHYPRSRRIYSWGYQVLVRLLFRVNVRDTQVGAKVFRREMLDVVLPLLLIKRYAFDLELLAVGAEFGFDRIEEIPIRLDYKFTGTGINLESVRRMFLDTLAIAYRIHLRHWYVRQFAALQRERTDAAARTQPLGAPGQELGRTAQEPGPTAQAPAPAAGEPEIFAPRR
jgi:glycosyltransferase involved in cell wall biosynthesis